MTLSYEKPADLERMSDAYSLGDVVQVMGKVRQAVESVIEGKRSAVDLALVVLLAEGHLLVEDVPGVGKTMLAKALGRSIASSSADWVFGDARLISSPTTTLANTAPGLNSNSRVLWL